MYNDEVSSDIQYLVTSIVDVNKQRRRVFVNYEPAFVLYNSEIRKYQPSVVVGTSYSCLLPAGRWLCGSRHSRRSAG